MAIVFTQQKKSQRVLIIVSILLTIITLIIVWHFFLRKDVPVEVVVPVEAPLHIDIDFEVLEKVRGFQPFIEIQPFQEVISDENEVEEVKIGRENPFISF